MHGMLRTYSGENAKKLANRLEERKDEIDKIIRGVPGLITWGLMRRYVGRVHVVHFVPRQKRVRRKRTHRPRIDPEKRERHHRTGSYNCRRTSHNARCRVNLFAKLPLSTVASPSGRSLDELDHGVDRLARRDDEAAASFDKGD